MKDEEGSVFDRSRKLRGRRGRKKRPRARSSPTWVGPGWCPAVPGEGLPARLGGVIGQPLRSRSEYAGIAQAGGILKIFQALQIDQGAVQSQPVQRLVEQARLVPPHEGGGQQQGFGISQQVGRNRPGVTGHAESAPLPPKQILRGFEGRRSKVGQ